MAPRLRTREQRPDPDRRDVDGSRETAHRKQASDSSTSWLRLVALGDGLQQPVERCRADELDPDGTGGRERRRDEGHEDRLSMLLLSVRVRLATKLSFSQARSTALWFLPMVPSTEVIEQTTLGFGRFTAEWFERRPAPDGDGEVLVVLIDGKCVPTATDRELKKRRGKRRKPRAPKWSKVIRSASSNRTPTSCPRSQRRPPDVDLVFRPPDHWVCGRIYFARRKGHRSQASSSKRRQSSRRPSVCWRRSCGRVTIGQPGPVDRGGGVRSAGAPGALPR